MPFDNRIRELCAELEQCHDDVRSLEILEELQAAMHERIEQIRGKVTGIALLEASEAKAAPPK